MILELKRCCWSSPVTITPTFATAGSTVPIAVLKKILPALGFLLLTGITLVLWRTQNEHQDQLLLHHMDNAAEQFRIRIVGMMSARMASLEMIRSRWIERQPPDFSRERFLGLARATVDHYPGIAGIYWVDPDGIVQWVFPQEDHLQTVGSNVLDHPEAPIRGLFSAGMQAREPVVTPCVALYAGGLGFYVIMPLRYDGRLLGCLVGVFKVKQLLEMSFSAAMLEDYAVSIHEGDRRIYQNMASGETDALSTRLTVSRDIQFAGKSWHLRLSPNGWHSQLRLPGQLAFLAFGFALSAMLALILYFLLQHMEMLRMSRDQALREVGERQKTEEALRENERKLQELLHVLAVKSSELESFVYAVSHDLKTPIVTIEGFIGALREDFGGVLPEAADRYLSYMSDASRKMALLINDLLELSRIDRLKEEKEELSLAEPIRKALATLKPQIDTRGILVRVHRSLPTIQAERNRMGQVMDNLLSNAVKYIGADNPSPLIEVGCLEEDDEPVFFVRDNGIGIENQYFDRVFQAFERLPSTLKVSEGTGMGLTIVKRIIESHGGRIWLQSEPGQGTTVFFSLPKKGCENRETSCLDKHSDR
jgi:signal transduction histidine kinase